MSSSENNGSTDDLSAGSLSGNANFLTEDLLKERSQERLYKLISFFIAWVAALTFLGAVLCFSYRIIHNPTLYWLPSSSREILVHSEQQEQTTTIPATGANNKDTTSTEPKSATNNPDLDNHQSTNPINQMLILLGLLSAIGTILAISVMRFSFSGNGSGKLKENNSTPTSPFLEILKEALEVVKDVFGKEAKD